MEDAKAPPIDEFAFSLSSSFFFFPSQSLPSSLIYLVFQHFVAITKVINSLERLINVYKSSLSS